jgi:biopolymer transport protein ExbB/TolQ
VTAIPAVIAFNLITHSIRDFAARTDDFALEVLNVVERQQPVSARVPEGVEVRR